MALCSSARLARALAKLKDGTTRVRNRVDLVLKPSNFVAALEDRLKNYVGYRGWQMTTSGPEKLKDGTTRVRHRVELVLVPANFVAALKAQYDKLLEDFGGEADELAKKVQMLEATIDRQQELHAALLGADKQRNELLVARAEHKAELLAMQLDYERRIIERDVEAIPQAAGGFWRRN
ncbi:hypothetical protein HDU90_005081 [Geranomyces variabilis]|nr:hypothetical protein HDU90_005081 [Geranomyces variabilis]